MLSPYGRQTLLTTLLVSVLMGSAGLLFFSGVFKLVVTILAAGLFFFTIYFFRDPERNPPDDPDAILAPADGKIILIKKISHPFTGPESTLVSIFMSVFNVHVNRIPCTGTIRTLTYHEGKFLPAFDEKSVKSNERMEIGLESDTMNIMFTQVAGLVARRIICDLTTGEPVKAGKRFGMIMFGSRLDIVVPREVDILVSKGEKTVAGETVIGKTDI